jgi:cobaltochelatase CobS
MPKKTVKLAGFELPVNPHKTPYLPQEQKIVGCRDTIKTLAYAVKTNKPVLIIGETGVGKTALIRYLAHRTKSGFRRINLNGQTSVDEFVGKTLLNKEGTYWQDGILTESLRNGYWLLADEINASLPEILFVLHSLLDDDNYIVLSENGGEIVKPHADFRFFATMNPSGKYAGTKELNKAFLSRFPIIIQLDFPKSKDEVKIIQTYAKITDKKALALVKMAQALRKAYRKDEIEFVCSTRDLINCAKIASDFDMKKALKLTVLSRCPEEDYKAVKTIVSLYFGSRGFARRIVDYEKEAKKANEKLEEYKRQTGVSIDNLFHNHRQVITELKLLKKYLKSSKPRAGNVMDHFAYINRKLKRNEELMDEWLKKKSE